jgi:L-aminopeptidase/D-esterase-like protein
MMEAIMDGYRVLTSPGSDTVIGTAATNVPISKAEMSKIAQMAHAVARAVVQAESLTEHQPPAHRDTSGSQ